MADPQQPLAERLIARLRANPIVAIALLLSSIVIGIASFTNAASSLVARFTHHEMTAAEARAELGKLGLPFTADAFVSSAGAGDASAVGLYLKAGMDPNSVLANGSTALASAAFNGRVPVVTRLLDAGAQIADPRGERSALFSSAVSRHNDIVKLMLERHPAQTVLDDAFVVAMRRKMGVPGRNDEGARLLADAGADVRRVAPQVFANLWIEDAGDDDATAVTRMLLARGAVLADMDGPDGKPVTTITPLMGAAQVAYASTATLLLQSGAKVDTRYARPERDGDGSTALMFAARGGSPVIVDTLLAEGANANDRDAFGQRALDYARRKRNQDPDAARVLLSLKAATAVR